MLLGNGRELDKYIYGWIAKVFRSDKEQRDYLGDEGKITVKEQLLKGI